MGLVHDPHDFLTQEQTHKLGRTPERSRRLGVVLVKKLEEISANKSGPEVAVLVHRHWGFSERDLLLLLCVDDRVFSAYPDPNGQLSTEWGKRCLAA